MTPREQDERAAREWASETGCQCDKLCPYTSFMAGVAHRDAQLAGAIEALEYVANKCCADSDDCVSKSPAAHAREALKKLREGR